MKTISEKFADFVSKLHYRDLSSGEIAYAKLLLLDYLGVAARGNKTESSKVLIKIATGKPYKTPSVIIGTGKLADASWSAFVNASSSHATEMDDTYYLGPVHIGSSIYSTAIAEAGSTKKKTTGKSFIEAIVVGYELAGRLAASQGKYAFIRGFHPTGTCNPFGSAALIAKLRKYDQDKIIAALGNVSHFACGTDSFMKEGAWTKRLHPGRAAFDGFFAAELAKNNFKAEHYCFEDIDDIQKGFLSIYSDKYDEKLLLDGLGKKFVISNCSIKPYPCCARSHGSIYALLELLSSENIHPDQIKSIKAEINSFDYEGLCLPENEKRAVKSVVEAQFSLHYALAAALVNNRLTMDEYTEMFISKGAWIKYIKLVSTKADKEMDKLYPKLWPSRVTIEMKGSGKKYSKYVENSIGTPANQLSWEQVCDMFIYLTKGIYTKDRQHQIIAMVSKLEKLNSVADLIELL